MLFFFIFFPHFLCFFSPTLNKQLKIKFFLICIIFSSIPNASLQTETSSFCFLSSILIWLANEHVLHHLFLSHHSFCCLTPLHFPIFTQRCLHNVGWKINLPRNNSIPSGLQSIKWFIFDLVSIKRIINAHFWCMKTSLMPDYAKLAKNSRLVIISLMP